jgi:hypothetical protein
MNPARKWLDWPQFLNGYFCGRERDKDRKSAVRLSRFETDLDPFERPETNTMCQAVVLWLRGLKADPI